MGGRQTTHKIISESNMHSEEKKSMREDSWGQVAVKRFYFKKGDEG